MNPALQKLGFDTNDRVLIIHADDVGMCHATLPAFADLLEFGLLSSASVMVPCPWFPQTAAFCRANPDVDMGVHLTVNCEWESYRWGPISTQDPASGLLDEDGYFHAWPPATQQHADPLAVVTEIRAQLRRAVQAGIGPTHVDSHMGTVAHPRFLQAYVQLAEENQLPGFFLRGGGSILRRMGLADEDAAAMVMQFVEGLEERGVPLFDSITMMPLDNPSEQVGVLKRIIDDLRPGLTKLILHPAQDTPELRAIAPDWRSRVANYEALVSSEARNYIQQSGVNVIGYRPLQELMRRQV